MENIKKHSKLIELKNVLVDIIFSHLDLLTILRVLPLQKKFLSKKKMNIRIYKLLYLFFSMSEKENSKSLKTRKKENFYVIELLKFPLFKNFLFKITDMAFISFYI